MLHCKYTQTRIFRSFSLLLISLFSCVFLSYTSTYAQVSHEDPAPPLTSLLSFSANPQEDSITLTWSTVDEVGKWGYNIWRSTTDSRGDAALVTSTPILSGDTIGGLYALSDVAVLQGLQYRYWVEELHIDGTTTEYGPLTAQLVEIPEVILSAVSPASTAQQLFLPLLFGN